MNLYDIVNRVLVVEYCFMVIFSMLYKRAAVIYWIGAVILQIGIIWGLK
jgi:hypothetical protein